MDVLAFALGTWHKFKAVVLAAFPHRAASGLVAALGRCAHQYAIDVVIDFSNACFVEGLGSASAFSNQAWVECQTVSITLSFSRSHNRVGNSLRTADFSGGALSLERTGHLFELEITGVESLDRRMPWGDGPGCDGCGGNGQGHRFEDLI